MRRKHNSTKTNPMVTAAYDRSSTFAKISSLPYVCNRSVLWLKQRWSDINLRRWSLNFQQNLDQCSKDATIKRRSLVWLMSAQMSADRDLGLNKQAFIGRFKAPDTAAPFYAITNHLYTTAYKQTNVVALSRCRRYKHVPEAGRQVYLLWSTTFLWLTKSQFRP